MAETLYQEEPFIFNRVPIKIYNHYLEGENIYTYLHWHRNIEFNITSQGRIRRTEGNTTVDSYPGDWSVINSGALHSNTFVDIHDTFAGTTLQISKSFVDSWLGEDVHLKVPESQGARRLISQELYKFAALEKQSDRYGLEAMELLYHFMILLKDYCIDVNYHPEKNMKKSENIIKEIINYIDEKYKEPVLLGEVAEKYHYSSAHLSRIFKEFTGQTFHSYVQNVRVMNSVNQIKKEPNKKLSDVAMDNGFANIKSFIETFKKFYGYTPSEWMKISKNDNHSEK